MSHASDNITAALAALESFQSINNGAWEAGGATGYARAIHQIELYSAPYIEAKRHLDTALRANPDTLILKVSRMLPDFEHFQGDDVGLREMHYVRYIGSVKELLADYGGALRDLALRLEVQALAANIEVPETVEPPRAVENLDRNEKAAYDCLTNLKAVSEKSGKQSREIVGWLQRNGQAHLNADSLRDVLTSDKMKDFIDYGGPNRARKYWLRDNSPISPRKLPDIPF